MFWPIVVSQETAKGGTMPPSVSRDRVRGRRKIWRPISTDVESERGRQAPLSTTLPLDGSRGDRLLLRSQHGIQFLSLSRFSIGRGPASARTSSRKLSRLSHLCLRIQRVHSTKGTVPQLGIIRHYCVRRTPRQLKLQKIKPRLRNKMVTRRHIQLRIRCP
jgi:hypothetical protein